MRTEERAMNKKEVERRRERRPDRTANSGGPREGGARPCRTSRRRRNESALQKEKP